MKRTFDEASDPINQGDTSSKRARIECQFDTSTLPKDIWGVILQSLRISDFIFLRATNSMLYKLCKELRPFPKYFVLDQDNFMEYLVKNGFISLLDYVKNTLHFEWTEKLCLVAAQCGQVEVLQHLVNNGLSLNADLLFECTKGTCSLSMVKYLHENGVPWDPPADTTQKQDPFLAYSSVYINAAKTAMESMAYHGHLSCMKYAVENGCTQRYVSYTPSIECLDFAIQNEFQWKGENDKGLVGVLQLRRGKRNICEEAARLGDLTMLKYAHQKGAPLKQSANCANQEGHLDCLIYADENSNTYPVPNMSKTFDCFKYIVQQHGLQELNGLNNLWTDQVRMGDIQTLRFMLNQGFPKPTDPMSVPYRVAAESSLTSVELFKFMLDEVKVSFDEINPYIWGIVNRNVEVLKLAFERNLPNKSPVQIQAQFGLGALTPSNLPLVQRLINRAIESENIEILKLLWEKLPNKEDLDMEQCMMTAAKYSTPEILDFLTQQGAQWTSEHLASVYDLPNMAYLTKIGCKWNDEECRSSLPLLIKYARAHGCTTFQARSLFEINRVKA